jgi:cystathionine gamma-synthase
VAAAIRPGRTRLIWVETPANPMWEITDLAGLCELAHAAGVRVAVDNTVATPVLTRPFEHGADLVVHSATKYLNGHGDVLAGAVLARKDPFWERIRSWRRNAGAMPGPFEAWLLQRGMRTLFLRVHRSCGSALAGHAHAVLREVRVFKRATSLGGVESLIEHRRSSEGPSSGWWLRYCKHTPQPVRHKKILIFPNARWCRSPSWLIDAEQSIETLPDS